MSQINGILLNEVLIPNLLNNPLAFCFFMNLDYFLPLTVQLDATINIFCLVLLTLEFLFPVFFFTSNT